VREKDNCYHAFNPSITVSTSAILSLEEKFQGGTGINLTPPPEQLISSKDCAHIKNLACLIAKQVSIQQYARLDIFYNTVTKKLQLIEVNTLPALSPSTVLFQQALAESPPISPKKLLSQLVIERMRVPESVY
jgi:D-alanine-D-alanine ligase-like ATP-grasp enzyme